MLDTIIEISIELIPVVAAGIITFFTTKYSQNKKIPLDKMEIAYNHVYYPLYRMVRNKKCSDINQEELQNMMNSILNEYDVYVSQSTRSIYLDYIAQIHYKKSDIRYLQQLQSNILAYNSKLRFLLGYPQAGIWEMYSCQNISVKRCINSCISVLFIYVLAIIQQVIECKWVGYIAGCFILYICWVLIICVLNVFCKLIRVVWNFIRDIFVKIVKLILDRESRVINVMKKRKMFYFKMGITLISFLGILCFKCILDFNESHSWLKDIQEIFYDLSIGVFSAMILVWLIDEMNSRIEKREEKKRHIVLYNKLCPSLTEYYEFFLKLYISTRKEKVGENEKVLKSLVSCKEEFTKQIIEADPFYKDGFYADPLKVRIQNEALLSGKEDIDDIMNMSTSLPWYRCWCYDSTIFFDSVERIEKDFPAFFPADLLGKVERLLALVKPIKNMSDVIEMKHLQSWLPKEQANQIIRLPIEVFLNEYKLIEVLEALEDVMLYIETETKNSLRERETKFFNERNVSPMLGFSHK